MYTANQQEGVLNQVIDLHKLDKKYGKDNVNAARKQFQPWYQFGPGDPADVEKWVQQHLNSQQQTKPQPINIYLDSQKIAEYTSASMNREARRR